MTNALEPQMLIGRTAVDMEGNKIGRVGQVYLSDRTDQPEWVTVSTGLFGNKETFAPLAGARADAENLVLAVSKDLVKDAPNVDTDGHLDEAENNRLYDHYAGYLGGGDSQPTGRADEDVPGQDTSGSDMSGQVGGPGRDTSGPTTDEAMTRSEERLRVGTEQVATGRARLRKYVVTENVTQTVPVSHDEVRLEREPITDANRGAAMSGGDITEEEHEVTLSAERPVVGKETVPVERVRLGKETVTGEETVDDTVRKEQVDLDEGTDTTR